MYSSLVYYARRVSCRNVKRNRFRRPPHASEVDIRPSLKNEKRRTNETVETIGEDVTRA